MRVVSKPAPGQVVIYNNEANKALQAFFDDLEEAVNRTTSTAPLASFVKANLPDAAANIRGLIYVSDEAGGATVAFSDGTNWRRMQDRAVVS